MVQEAAVETKPSKWRDIEPVLKWVSVAYVFGFLIVMVHTYRLGVPTLQLIEPVNIWIGAPLAILAFFLDKLYAGVRRSMVEFRSTVRGTVALRTSLYESGADARELNLKIGDIWAIALSQFGAPLGLIKPVQWALRSMIRKGIELSLHGRELAPLSVEDRKDIVNRVEPILRWAQWIGAFNRFATVVVYSTVAILACWAYVELFSKIPQTLGGGKPMAVTLMVSAEALPETKPFEEWRGTATGKESVALPVTLHFRTEHEWIIQHEGGPVVALEDHAVEGVMFPPK